MKKVVTILSLLAISFTVQARTMLDESKQLADQIVAEANADRADRTASRTNPKDYYERKLSLCLFEQDIRNDLSSQKKPVDLSACSGIISRALDRGDLNEAGIRSVIDSLRQKRSANEAEVSARVERQKQIDQQTKDLINYGNQKLN